MKLATVLLIATVTPVFASAQQVVGYPPDKSPYQDVETPQRITIFGGYYHANKDDKGAAPGSAPVVGLRYDLTLGGISQFFVRSMWVTSDRTAFNPVEQSATSQNIGKVNDPLVMVDLGFALDLTGQKSWHHLMPTAGFAIGIANASHTVAVDPYDFGSQFTLSTDFGLRYVPGKGNTYQIQINAGNTLYQNHYPSGYFTAQPPATTPVLGGNVSKSSYLNNWMFTGGLSIPIFR